MYTSNSHGMVAAETMDLDEITWKCNILRKYAGNVNKLLATWLDIFKKKSFIKGLRIRCPISPASYINVASDGMSAVASRFCQTVAFFLDPVKSAQFQ